MGVRRPEKRQQSSNLLFIFQQVESLDIPNKSALFPGELGGGGMESPTFPVKKVVGGQVKIYKKLVKSRLC